MDSGRFNATYLQSTGSSSYNAAFDYNADGIINAIDSGFFSRNYLVGYNYNLSPTVATAASATPSPVTGNAAVLSVLGASNGGESNLSYTWVTTGTVPAAVTFSANGSNAAKNTTATFTKAGVYNFQVAISDGGSSATSALAVTVSQTLTTLAVSIGASTVTSGTTRQFTATSNDQFGNAIASPAVTWSLAPGAAGTISATGLYTAPTITSDVSDSVVATSGSLSSTSTPVPIITVDEAVPPATNVHADTAPEGAVVSWDQAFGYTATIYRSIDDGLFIDVTSMMTASGKSVIVGTASAPGYINLPATVHESVTDTTLTVGQKVSYKVQMSAVDAGSNATVRGTLPRRRLSSRRMQASGSTPASPSPPIFTATRLHRSTEPPDNSIPAFTASSKYPARSTPTPTARSSPEFTPAPASPNTTWQRTFSFR